MTRRETTRRLPESTNRSSRIDRGLSAPENNQHASLAPRGSEPFCWHRTSRRLDRDRLRVAPWSQPDETLARCALHEDRRGRDVPERLEPTDLPDQRAFRA